MSSKRHRLSPRSSGWSPNFSVAFGLQIASFATKCWVFALGDLHGRFAGQPQCLLVLPTAESFPCPQLQQDIIARCSSQLAPYRAFLHAHDAGLLTHQTLVDHIRSALLHRCLGAKKCVVSPLAPSYCSMYTYHVTIICMDLRYQCIKKDEEPMMKKLSASVLVAAVLAVVGAAAPAAAADTDRFVLHRRLEQDDGRRQLNHHSSRLLAALSR